MPDARPSGWDEIHELIERVDELCRQSEQIRERSDAKKQQPFWPDQRRSTESDLDGTPSDRRHHP